MKVGCPGAARDKGRRCRLGTGGRARARLATTAPLIVFRKALGPWRRLWPDDTVSAAFTRRVIGMRVRWNRGIANSLQTRALPSMALMLAGRDARCDWHRISTVCHFAFPRGLHWRCNLNFCRWPEMSMMEEVGNRPARACLHTCSCYGK
jgi:hypothetical protein